MDRLEILVIDFLAFYCGCYFLVFGVANVTSIASTLPALFLGGGDLLRPPATLGFYLVLLGVFALLSVDGDGDDLSV